MVQSALSSLQMTRLPQSLAERLAAERQGETKPEATVSSMAERFAPEAMSGVNDRRRPMLDAGLRQSPLPQAGRFTWPKPGVFAVLTAVAFVPATILAGLLWLGAIRGPGTNVWPRDSGSQQAAVAATPALVPTRATQEIALTAPGTIEATAGEDVGFAITIDSAAALPPRSVIALHDIPEGAVFSHGRPYGATEWTLKPDEITDLRLRLPEGKAGRADIRVELMAADGKVLARAVTRLAVASDPKADLIVRSDESGRVDDLMAHGNNMIAVGYLAGARAYFKRAAEAGSGDAALALGATYDPAFIEEIGAQGIKADPESAKTWYDRAELLGIGDKEAKLRGLKQDWARHEPQPAPAAAEPEEAPPAPVKPPKETDAKPNPGALSRLVAAAVDLASKDEWVEVSSAVNVRAGPSSKDETNKVAQAGTKLRVLGRKGNWVQIANPATKEEGWIYARFLKPADAP